MEWGQPPAGSDAAPFKFNFGGDSGVDGGGAETTEADHVDELPAEELSAADAATDAQAEYEGLVVDDELTILKRRLTNAASLIGTADIKASDLVPGRYEGGFKLWECAVDLIHHMHEALQGGTLSIKDRTVLELGCGHGLPGIYTMLQGAKEVTWQDYNREVLTALTIPTVAENRGVVDLDAAGVTNEDQLRYLAGDWARLHGLLKEHAYDLILTTDTIYSTGSQQKLYDLIKHCLNPKTGICLIGAKSHYFGVGGSVRQFERLVEKDGAMHCERVRSFADGSSNVREILAMVPLTAEHAPQSS